MGIHGELMIRFLLAIFLLATPAHAGMVIGSGAVDYSDIIFWSGFEDGGGDNLETSNCNNGTDTTWARNSGATINATTPLAGSYDLSCPSQDDYDSISITSGDYFNTEVGAFVMLFKPVATQNGSGLLRIRETTASQDFLLLRVRAADSNDLQFLWYKDNVSESACYTTGNTIVNGTALYVVLMWDVSASTISLTLFDTSGTQVDTCSSESAITALTDIETGGYIRPGDSQAVANTNFSYDKLVVFNGSIARTAQQYVDIVRGNASCPR